MQRSLFAARSLAVVSTLLVAGCGGKTSAGSARPASAPSPASAPAAASAAPANPADTLPSSITPAMATEGRALFNDGSCAKCHGPNGGGGPYGPNLIDTKWVQMTGTYPEIVDVIARGVPASKQKLPGSSAQFAMRARGGMDYSDDEVRKIAAYVWTASHGRK